MTATLPRPAREGAARVDARRTLRAPGVRRLGKPTAPSPEPLSPGLMMTSTATVILAMILLAFLLEVSVVGAVRHARAQSAAYDELRADLAQSVGATGQLDADGAPHALGKPVALLNIPAIGLSEVVLEGTTSRVLQSGPGHRRDTVFPGQPGTSVVMGRRASYGGPFSKIASLKPGATIEIVTGQSAQTIVYRVTGVRYAGGTATIGSDPTAGRLTLVTADGPPYLPSDAVRVDADLVTTALPAPGLAFGSSSLATSEAAMAGDDSNALRLFLWAQLLLVLAVALVWVRARWGAPQTRMVAIPLLGLTGLQVAHYAAQLLPNLM